MFDTYNIEVRRMQGKLELILKQYSKWCCSSVSVVSKL